MVGSAQSGCQIAEELYQSGRKVYLSVGRAGRVPLQDGFDLEVLTELDLKSAGITNVIWATGYAFDFSPECLLRELGLR